MLRSMVLTVYGIAFIIALVLGYLYTQAEYQAVKKYYPELTFFDYCVIGEKLRITPNGE